MKVRSILKRSFGEKDEEKKLCFSAQNEYTCPCFESRPLTMIAEVAICPSVIEVKYTKDV